MARIKSTAGRKHREMLGRAKGFKQARRRRIQTAKEALLHAGQYAYEGRKNKKRDLRGLWIIRLNAAVKTQGISYSKFINGLKKNKIDLDRKILSEMAISDPEVLKSVIKEAGFSLTSK
jgi:large subunit ribosomal protein L20